MFSACVIVPIKRFSLATTRLSTALAPHERRALVLSMAEDVLRTVTNPSRGWGVVVVTAEPEIARRAESLGAAVLPEPSPNQSLQSAVQSATETLVRLGIERLAYVPSDAPLVVPEDIAALVGDDHRADVVRCVTAVRDNSITGVSWPATLSMTIPFGPGGAEQLENQVRLSGKRFDRLDLPRLAYDIDTVADLLRLRACPSDNGTYRLLQNWPQQA
jgi:2-phospho-L-lactate guanylyltransferase